MTREYGCFPPASEGEVTFKTWEKESPTGARDVCPMGVKGAAGAAGTWAMVKFERAALDGGVAESDYEIAVQDGPVVRTFVATVEPRIAITEVGQVREVGRGCPLKLVPADEQLDVDQPEDGGAR